MNSESYISVFDMLKVGIGPSSSHTLGPWQAARKFIQSLTKQPLGTLLEIQVHIYGSLALTGKGHASDKAILLGLSGLDPATSELARIQDIAARHEIELQISESTFCFSLLKNLHFHPDTQLPFHPNGMRMLAVGREETWEQVYYSIGGGFVVQENEVHSSHSQKVPFPCNNSTDLLKACLQAGCSISELVWQNECALRSEEEIQHGLQHLWQVMKESAYVGCHTEGILPGGLQVKRRAAALNKQLLRNHSYTHADEWLEAMKEGRDFRKVLTRISCLAMAVNEVNASMGRIVTAPTNGSAGVLPAVIIYYWCFSGQTASIEDVYRFLLTAAEIGKYFKRGATISAAAGGCQAEIGVSSSMAAAGLTECLGGSPQQVLMAAEIAAEHHLGLTCDPIGGLVQIPCIERNSMGAIKAVTAAMIALESTPSNAKVSLDEVIKTMKETAEHMNSRFKETSQGGLATNVSVNLPEC
ncbi:MAG: L-serine ammonia-lyase [Cytophagaceae bacterium]|jgi:L-serine dehydratase|nr:L-serine ammonia-lyase [Cytophagaceae bacterium]